jgi:hypothetical protein
MTKLLLESRTVSSNLGSSNLNCCLQAEALIEPRPGHSGTSRWVSEKWNFAVSAVFDYGIMLQVRFAETPQDFDFEGANTFIKPRTNNS